MVSCSGFGLPMHAQLLRLFVTLTVSYMHARICILGLPLHAQLLRLFVTILGQLEAQSTLLAQLSFHHHVSLVHAWRLDLRMPQTSSHLRNLGSLLCLLLQYVTNYVSESEQHPHDNTLHKSWPVKPPLIRQSVSH